MKELVSYIAKALVDKPEDVVVTEIEGEQTSVLELKVAKEDLGKDHWKAGPHRTRHENDSQCGLHED